MTKAYAALAALLAVPSAILLVSTASAHARYKSSIPATGDVLAASPARVEITFTQEIQKVKLFDGEFVPARPVEGESKVCVDDERERIEVPRPLQLCQPLVK